jgi:hypothetical protein
MSTTYILRSLTILSEMHVEVLLHGLLALCRIGESETTLLTLYRHAIVEKMYYVRTMSGIVEPGIAHKVDEYHTC